jgi:hypothetical protein
MCTYKYEYNAKSEDFFLTKVYPISRLSKKITYFARIFCWYMSSI